MRLGVRGVVCNLGVFDSKCLRINGFRWCAIHPLEQNNGHSASEKAH